MLRYVNATSVNEKMLALVDTSCDTSADGLLQTLQEVTNDNNTLLQTMYIADAFEGASNRSAQYNGLQAKLKELSPHHIYKWCYSHVLNLVISNSCTSLESVSFFGLLQEL